MEHINCYLKEVGQPHGKGAYPRTDDILSRAINLISFLPAFLPFWCLTFLQYFLS